MEQKERWTVSVHLHFGIYFYEMGKKSALIRMKCFVFRK